MTLETVKEIKKALKKADLHYHTMYKGGELKVYVAECNTRFHKMDDGYKIDVFKVLTALQNHGIRPRYEIGRSFSNYMQGKFEHRFLLFK